MSRESLNAVEDRTAFEAEGNRHVMGGEKSLRCALTEPDERVVSEVENKPSRGKCLTGHYYGD